jgi:NAD+ kinase
MQVRCGLIAHMRFPFKIVALIGKHRAPEIAEPLLRLAAFLVSRGVTVVVDSLTAEYVEGNHCQAMTLAEIGSKADLAIVLGGDGTMLNIARTLSLHKVPLVGINQGRLGFLTDVTLDSMQEAIGAMLDGKFVTEQRLLLAARVLRNGDEVHAGRAFNEVVVHRNNTSTMMEFEVRIDGEYLYNQRADGLIVSTPTGSTAYAMSSGGPILHPTLEAIELVPISPHTLSNRPIVVKSSAEVEILVHRTGDVQLRCDSHTTYDLHLHDKIIVTRHPEAVCLLHPQGHSYYHTLREKLLWNQML